MSRKAKERERVNTALKKELKQTSNVVEGAVVSIRLNADHGAKQNTCYENLGNVEEKGGRKCFKKGACSWFEVDAKVLGRSERRLHRKIHGRFARGVESPRKRWPNGVGKDFQKKKRRREILPKKKKGLPKGADGDDQVTIVLLLPG